MSSRAKKIVELAEHIENESSTEDESQVYIANESVDNIENSIFQIGNDDEFSDFDSDDSLKDENYEPSESSEDSQDNSFYSDNSNQGRYLYFISFCSFFLTLL